MEVSDDEDELVFLVCTNTDSIQTAETLNDEILLSTADILSWDLPTILTFPTIKVQAHSNRLIEQSMYFSGLLSGNFSESCLGSISINWNVSDFLQILKHMCDCVLDITLDNFFPLYEGALYFGVESLLLKCDMWLSEVLSSEGFQYTQIKMEDLIQIWKFGSDRASDYILHLCMGYLARNFMWAKRSKFFVKLPYDLLLSSVKHPHLTVDSELHLSDALLLWLESNLENLERPSKTEDNCIEILKQIRVGLLPLWFALGKRNSFYFRQLAEETLDSIFRILNIVPMGSLDTFKYSDSYQLRIRLTEYSKKVNLSGCPQITSTILRLSLIPQSYLTDPIQKKIIEKLFISCKHPVRDRWVFPQNLSEETLTFEAVQEVDISKCQNLHVELAVDCFRKSFPSLRTLKAGYLLNIGTTSFLQLLEKCPLVCEIDLTVDITPLIPASVTVLSSSPAEIQPVPEKTSNVKYQAVQIMSFNEFGPPLSNVTKLTLEGRTDVSDLGLHYISKLCVSLCHLNIKGCISVTDIGISDLISTSKKLNSIVVCDTSFGINGVQALCSAISDSGNTSSLHSTDKRLNSVVSNFETLHMGGCQGVSKSSLMELMSQTQVLKSLCLRGTDLIDQGLYNFVGSSLEMLDISNTKVISDIIVMNFAASLKNLQVLAMCYCFGDISMSSFKFPMQSLRKLRLERVTPWMTNDDLIVLTQNCRNLAELSLLGCSLLDSDSLPIISCGWSGLVSIHLEECGEVTANGASALLDCKALEDILLRHNGPGLCRNFIFYAASEMPMLRKLSLDICDAREGDFDIPNYEGRYSLSTLNIARCKSQRCAFNVPASTSGARSRSVHMETLVLVWNSRDLIRTVVKERL
ncbi:BTB/POZ domain-containing protein FBL11 isoform X5 [Vigna angularis]|uniref:BTB/POZ domain-containing protein FBL11 isoform X5 n=1 Tax=Phaseolus angularis TaxID=3914 RepID=UPI0022B34983|nr:BTB/POZ domain-containing protein FBL11 isoform X5 [Vigna angularis]